MTTRESERLCAVLESRKKFEKCVEAADGNEAVLQSLELNPRLVILDIMMPVLAGYSAAKKIKEALPNIPILMFSTDTSPDIPRLSHSVDAQGFVSKNRLGEMLQAVDALLAGGTYFPNDDHNSI
jgi:two-component system nitrate/nitrite response regulator NarL